MKKTLKLLIALFIFAVAFTFTAIPSEAASKTVTLKENKWTTGTYNLGYNYYKVVAPATGFCHIYVQSGLVIKDIEESKTYFEIVDSTKKKRLAQITATSAGGDDIHHYLKKGEVIYVRTYGESGDKHRVAFKMVSNNPIYTLGTNFNMKFTDTTLKNGVYVGFKANKTGVLVVNTTSTDVFNMFLTNRNRVNTSREVLMGHYHSSKEKFFGKVEFGVQQNQVYYLKLTDTYGGYGDNRITFKAGIQAAYAPSTTMNTARGLAYSKPVTTALYTKGYSWYKFYLSSPKKITLYVNTVIYRNSTDKFYVTVYKQGSSTPVYHDKTGKHGYTYTGIKNGALYSKSSTREYDLNLGKGMYYVRVATTAYTANGYTKVWYK